MRHSLPRPWRHPQAPLACVGVVALLMLFNLWQQHRQWLLLITETPEITNMASEPKRQPRDWKELDALFGRPTTEPETPPQKTTLPFILLGSFVNKHSDRSTSIIQLPGAPPIRASTGQELAPGVHLLAIATDHVLLSREGKSEYLFFPQVMTAQSTAGEMEKRHMAFGASQLAKLSGIQPDGTVKEKLKELRKEIARKP